VLYHNFPHRPEQGSAQQSVVQWVGLQATAGVRRAGYLARSTSKKPTQHRPCPVSERLAKHKFSHWGFPVNSNEAGFFLLSCLANRSLSGQHLYERYIVRMVRRCAIGIFDGGFSYPSVRQRS